MSSQPDSGEILLQELKRHVADLDRRVASLEQQAGRIPIEQPAVAAGAAPQRAAELERPLLGDTANVLPLLGTALLGIAGAYLLRALTEFGVLPLRAGVGCGILYALSWLVHAARTAPERRLVAAVHGVTSVLILMPLLWEAAIRFHAISTWEAAGVLVLFSGFGLAISWRKNLSVIAWITTLAGLVAASALLIATHDLVPFTLALLAIAAAVEFSAVLEHWLRERWIVALVTDLAVLLLTYIVAREAGVPEGYAPISLTVALTLQVALLAIYLLSTIVRTLWHGLNITTFETAQLSVAWLLSMGGALRVAHGEPGAVSAVSIVSLVGGAACYVVSFAFLERAGHRDRNFYTYSTFGLLLVFTGSRILLSGVELVLTLSVLALVCLWIGEKARRRTLEWHGAIYLCLAAMLSGLSVWTTTRLMGGANGWVAPEPAAWASAAAAVLGYVLIYRTTQSGTLSWGARLLVLLVAANCAWTVAGLAAGALTAICDRPGGSATLASLCPTVRTGVLTVLSVTLAWIGRKWKRFELVWLVYPLMVLTAYRLVFQDLRQGQTLALFASLLLYGGALVLLPRILQKVRRA